MISILTCPEFISHHHPENSLQTFFPIPWFLDSKFISFVYFSFYHCTFFFSSCLLVGKLKFSHAWMSFFFLPLHLYRFLGKKWYWYRGLKALLFYLLSSSIYIEKSFFLLSYPLRQPGVVFLSFGGGRGGGWQGGGIFRISWAFSILWFQDYLYWD